MITSGLAWRTGVSVEALCAFPARLAGFLLSWLNDHRSKDIAARLTQVENAIRGDQQRGRRSR